MDNAAVKPTATKEVAQCLLDIGAIQINVHTPFTWVSGIKSPIYCDNRKVNSDVKARNIVLNAFLDVIKTHFAGAEIIAGVATGGIPIGALIADRLNLPFIYVRQAPKEHGMMKQVEGSFKPGSKVVLIEDHISTGGSSLKAVDGLRNEGLELMGLISIMTYGFPKATALFANNNVTQLSVCNLDVVIEVALAAGSISTADKDTILAFKNAQA